MILEQLTTASWGLLLKFTGGMFQQVFFFTVPQRPRPKTLDRLSLHSFQLNICQKGLSKYRILFYLHSTQRPNFFGIGVNKTQVKLSKLSLDNYRLETVTEPL